MTKAEIIEKINELEGRKFIIETADYLTLEDKNAIANLRKEIRSLQNRLDSIETKEAVNNVPDYAVNYQYWVVREVDGAMWFYGAYETDERAKEVAGTVNGIVLS